jgi:hypothetical protein
MPESVLGLRVEGLDPDNPAVIAAIDLVRWELSLINLSRRTCPKGVRALCPGHSEGNRLA